MKKSKLSCLLNVLLVLVVIALIVILVMLNPKLETRQDEYKEFEYKESITLIIPGETNIRSYHATGGSGEENVEMIISQNREYDWCLKLSRYYRIEDYAGRVWYGIPADTLEQDNAPKAVRKWCEKHPDLIFWVCTAGGVTVD